MKIEWLLAEFDKEIHDYTELREQLGELLSDSDEYTHAEADLRIQIMRLKVEINVVLNAIGEADN